MHTVSVKSSAVAAPAPSQPSPQTPMKPPLVTVHSPGSVRSPPRSPRLSGLLLALKDVIGEDPDDEYDPLTGTTYVEEEPLSAYDTSETITVFNNHSFHAGIEETQSTVESSGSIQTVVHQPLINDDDETLRLPSRLDDPEAQPSIYTTESSPDANFSAANPQPPSDLLSPTELSHLHLGSFIQGSTEAVVHDSDSIDSGYADTWRPPFPTSRSPPRNPLKSTFGVLSSPCGTAFSRVLSPRLSAFISRPPQSPFAPAIVDDDVPSELSLDSPAGDAFAEAEEAEPSEEYIVVEEDLEDAQDPVEDDSEGDAENDPEEDGHDHDDDCHTDGGNSSASSWDDQADPTAVYLGMPEVTPEEISIAIQRASRTPSHFLNNGVDLDFGEAVASSSMEISAQEEPFAAEALDSSIPVDDIFGEGVSSYIPASDVSFNSSAKPSGPIDDGLDGIPAQDESFASGPLDPSIPVDDIFGEGVSSYIPASDVSFNSSVQPNGPMNDGFAGIPAQDESSASEPLAPPIPVDDIFREGVSSYIPASDVSFHSSVQPDGPIDDGFAGIPAQDEPFASEALDPSSPVDDIFGEGVSSYIPASDVSFNSSIQPSGPIDAGFGGIPVQEESFASEPLHPSVPVDDIFGEGVSSYIPASDVLFNSSAQRSGPIDDGFDEIPTQEELFASEPLDPPVPVDDIFGEGVSSYIPASDVSFNSSVQPSGPIDDGFDEIPTQEELFASEPLDPPVPVDDIFGEGVSSYIPASDVSFNSSVQPSGPTGDGHDGSRGHSSVVFSSLDDSFNSESSDPSSPVYDDLEDDDADYIPIPEHSFTSELRDLVDPVDDSLRDGLTNSSIHNLDADDSFISELSSPSSPAEGDFATYIAGVNDSYFSEVHPGFNDSYFPELHPGVNDSYISEVQSHSGIVDDGFGVGAVNSSVDILNADDSFISESSGPSGPADGDYANYIPGDNDSYISEVQSHSGIVDDSFGGGAGNSTVDIPSPVEDSFDSSSPPSPADDDSASYIPVLNDSYISDVHSHSGFFDDSFDGGAGNSSVDISSPVEDSFDEGDVTVDYTAQLAYLSSPTAINENDTLQYLYDQYSDFSEESEEQPANLPKTTAIGPPPEDPPPALVEVQPLSATTPMRSGFIRERVFTPPPTLVRGRSGTVTTPADSPRSTVSPPVPFSSLSQGRASPRSQSGRSAWSPDSAVSELEEPVVSKKVPFGFRNSLAGRARASTFVPNRQSRRDSRAIELPPVKASQSDRASPSPEKITSASPVTGGLRPLRLSTVLSSQPASAPSRNSTFSVNRYRQSGISHRASISSISVLSDSSYSRNPILLSTRASNIPQHIRNTRFSPDNPIPSPLSSYHLARLANFSPQSAPLSRPSSWYSNPADVNDMTETTYQYDRPFSRASEPPLIHEEDEEDQEETYDHTIRRPLPTVPHSAPVSHRVSVMRPPSHAIVTPKPTLMFAIASDDVKQVRQVLQSGDAGPNDAVGPQSALAFALTNDQLTNKMEIVKTLLAFGADPKAVVQQTSSLRNSEEDGGAASPPAPSLMDAMDPATRYYVERADAAHTRRTSALIHRSFFRPLTRVRYELIGQDRALEQLFKDLSMHSRQLSVTPIVVLLCGPSGHGKSLLARKFGALLDVPTHTVDMTTIHSAQDLWKSYSMSPYDPPSTRSLAEFLIDNEGKRCVVVLDEIEKTHGESPLWALLMPWEHGRCTFEAHGRLVDVRNVVWLGTSNIGQDLVLEHHSARALPDQLMSREEYTELMGLLRPRVSERLGASMLSRVTTALPFVPFTPEERRAICFEALHTIAGDIIGTLSTDVVDGMVAGALANYTVAEGARSLYRAVSNQLVDNI